MSNSWLRATNICLFDSLLIILEGADFVQTNERCWAVLGGGRTVPWKSFFLN
jgi:hypothetical protein